jgi:antibiotic biosynthesis monooxygenase (ABM) superfamily enzyme
MSDEDPPVTGILEVFVQRGKESAFEESLRELAKASIRQPGHMGISTLRPQGPSEPYRVIYKYDRRSNYDRWHTSDERQVLFAAVQQHAARAVTRQESGLESWLEFASAGGPPKWKSTLVSWLGIYPTALVVTFAMQATGIQLETPLRILVLSILVVPTTAYLVGPRMAYLMRNWLHSSG